MKYKTTDKAIRAGYNKIIKVGYANLQFLLKCEEAVAYNTRVEGWKYDVYAFDNVAICTGYAPIGNIKPDYETCKKYDKRAEKILENKTSWTEAKEELSALIRAFIAEVTGENAA